MKFVIDYTETDVRIVIFFSSGCQLVRFGSVWQNFVRSLVQIKNSLFCDGHELVIPLSGWDSKHYGTSSWTLTTLLGYKQTAAVPDSLLVSPVVQQSVTAVFFITEESFNNSNRGRLLNAVLQWPEDVYYSIEMMCMQQCSLLRVKERNRERKEDSRSQDLFRPVIKVFLLRRQMTMTRLDKTMTSHVAFFQSFVPARLRSLTFHW